jgi:preprotein translocase subunit SecG
MSVIAGIFLICAIVLILVVLIQKGKGGGLSSAFAGGMASGILGSKTGDVLTWITIGVVGLFLVLALVLDKWWRPTVAGPMQQAPAPITSTETGGGEGQTAPAGQPATPPAEQPGQAE